jgi:hypothetical protein
MNKLLILKINNKKLYLARKYVMIFCLLQALISSMILAFYHTQNFIFYYYIGYNLLHLSILFFVFAVICASAFDYISSNNT